MSEELIGFGVNDREVLMGSRAETYKGRKDETDRIAFCWFYRDDAGKLKIGQGNTPKFKQALTHYQEGLGYFESTGEYTINKFGAPRRKIATFIIKYRTSKHGDIPKDSAGNPIVEYEIMDWKFSEDKYRQLEAIHKEFNLSMHDIKVTCSDSGFQKMTFTACNGTALWQQNKETFKAVIARVAQMEGNLSLARKYTVDEIKEKLGESEGVVVPSTASDVNYDDLMDSLD